MKLLLLSDLNSIHTKKWVAGLSVRGCEIVVFGLSKPTDDFYSDLKNVQIEYADLSGFRERSFWSKMVYLKQRKKLKQVYRAFQPEIVHAHYATSYGLLGSLLKHKPFLISVWGTEIFDFPKASTLNRLILKRNLSKASHLFSTSLVMAKETNLYTNKKVAIVPFGVDVSHFKPTENDNSLGDITIGIIKTLEKNYGINYLIDAFKIIVDKYGDQTFKLLIAGEGREEGVLMAQAKKLGLDDQIVFKGYIPHRDVPSCFNEMDIAVIASLSESFGVSAVEASACEKPVVATDVGGLHEVVVDGETGFLCRPQSAESLAEKLSVLIEDEALRKSMGQKGRKFVLEKYDWEKNVDQMMTHYNQIMKMPS